MRPTHLDTDRRPTTPTWTGVVVAFALALAVPAVLWALSHPQAAGLVLAGFAGLWVLPRTVRAVTRRPRRLCVPRTGVCVRV